LVLLKDQFNTMDILETPASHYQFMASDYLYQNICPVTPGNFPSKNNRSHFRIV